MTLKNLALLICLTCASWAAAGPATTANPKLPTLFIIGDSTVHNGANGGVGWGDPMKAMFDRARINVENRAIGGRSSRTFRNEGRWQKVLEEAKAGDFVLMQFGHNDPGAIDDDKARGSLSGGGAETKTVKKKDGGDETVHTFGWYMEQYIIEAKAKGLTPIVCSYIPHCPRPEKGQPAVMPHLPISPTSYALWAKEAAEKEHADFIDLNGIIWQHYAGLTPDELKSKYFTEVDFTHTNAAGAELNARCVVEGLRQLKANKLNGYVLADAAK